MNTQQAYDNFSPSLIPAEQLANPQLAEQIATSRFVVCGEVHGATQNCDVLYSLIIHYGITSLALELYAETCKAFIDSCIAGQPNFELIDADYFIASVMSVEMAKTLAVLVNEKKISDIHYTNGNTEQAKAHNILALKQSAPTICLMGNWHTEAELVVTDGIEHKSAYMIVRDSEPESINIRYKYLSGAIYNVGTGIMRFNGLKSASGPQIDDSKYAIAAVPGHSRCYRLTVPRADPTAH